MPSDEPASRALLRLLHARHALSSTSAMRYDDVGFMFHKDRGVVDVEWFASIVRRLRKQGLIEVVTGANSAPWLPIDYIWLTHAGALAASK